GIFDLILAKSRHGGTHFRMGTIIYTLYCLIVCLQIKFHARTKTAFIQAFLLRLSPVDRAADVPG
ncbi:MAG: hypothetical protein DRH37_10700, partial [Deltaproteobacteria bacterium]